MNIVVMQGGFLKNVMLTDFVFNFSHTVHSRKRCVPNARSGQIDNERDLCKHKKTEVETPIES